MEEEANKGAPAPPAPKRIKITIEPHIEKPVHHMHMHIEFAEDEKTPAQRLFQKVEQLDFGRKGDEVEQYALEAREKSYGRGGQEQVEADGQKDAVDGEAEKVGEEGGADVANTSMLEFQRWEKFRKSIAAAIYNVDMTLDLLATLDQRKYMKVEAAPGARPRKCDLALRWSTKRASLEHASSILAAGADSLSRVVEEEGDYYVDLQTMQKRWRLTQAAGVESKQRAMVMVDVSYTTAGSAHAEGGELAVVREERLQEGGPNEMDLDGVLEGGEGEQKPRAVRVLLPAEFETPQVIVCGFGPLGGTATKETVVGPRGSLQGWGGGTQGQLRQAQHMVFCRDLFMLLARLAASNTSVPAEVQDSVIRLQLDLQTQLTVRLGPPTAPPTPQNPHTFSFDMMPSTLSSLDVMPPVWGSVVSMLLHGYLRMVHARVDRRRKFPRAFGYMATALENGAGSGRTDGDGDRREGEGRMEERYGPAKLNAEDVIGGDARGEQALLHGVFNIAQHVALCHRLRAILDEIVHAPKDPLSRGTTMSTTALQDIPIYVHWTPTPIPTVTACTVIFHLAREAQHSPSLAAEETLDRGPARKLVRIVVRGVQMTATTDSGGVYELGEHDLAPFAMTQTCAAAVAVLRAKAVALGWNILQDQSHRRISDSIALVLEKHSTIVTLRCSPTNTHSIKILALITDSGVSEKRNNTKNTSAHMAKRAAGGSDIPWERLMGQTLCAKLHTLLTGVDDGLF